MESGTSGNINNSHYKTLPKSHFNMCTHNYYTSYVNKGRWMTADIATANREQATHTLKSLSS